MLIVCSWCGEPQGYKEPMELERVTHTICQACKIEVSPKVLESISLNEMVERLGANVQAMAMDGDFGPEAQRIAYDGCTGEEIFDRLTDQQRQRAFERAEGTRIQ